MSELIPDPATPATEAPAADPAASAPVTDASLLGTPVPAEKAPEKPASEAPVTEKPPEKPAAEKPPEKPAELELKLPTDIDQGLLDKFKPLAKEIGLDSPKAQKLVDLYGEAVKGFEQRTRDAWMDQRKTWVAEVKTDKVLGGAKLSESVGLAQKAVQKFGGDKLREFFDKTGIGDAPELFRAFVAIGRELSEDTVGNKPPAGPASEPLKPAQRLAKLYDSPAMREILKES